MLNLFLKGWPFYSALAIWLLYAGFFLIFSNHLSYGDPFKAQYMKPFLARFFANVCNQDAFNSQRSVREASCVYTFQGKGLPASEPSGKVLFNITNASFSFLSYENRILKLKYKVEFNWRENNPRPSIEEGTLVFDLSLYDSNQDVMSLRVIPYLTYHGFLIQEVADRLDLEKEPLRYMAWGVILASKLISLRTTGESASFDNKFPHFVVRAENSSYLQLKNYFERGEIYEKDPLLFLYYSGALLSTSALGEIVPNTRLMRVATVLESVFGLFLFGAMIGVAGQWFKTG